MKAIATAPGEDTKFEEPTAEELAQATIDAQPKPLEVLKSEALAALDIEFEKQVVELTGNKPNAERQMWMLINLTAKAFLAGDESGRGFLEEQVPPMKTAELIAAGEDVAIWKANDAKKKEAVTATVVQMAMGMKKTAEEAIEAAATHQELATMIETLKAQEAAKIASFKAAITAQQTA